MLEQKDHQISDIKFNICAFIDLLGFSSHLEVSSYDLRTAIGEQAINRLKTLEVGMDLIIKETKGAPQVLPKDFNIQRINDAIICTMDLNDFLLPSTGQTGFTGIKGKDLDVHFDINAFSNPTEFESAYESRIFEAIVPIIQFIGMIARLHLFIQKNEKAGFFPGSRTIISSGFRRPFRTISEKDDALSANFAFSNAVEADKFLHGPHLYIDNNLITLCSNDRLARNLIRFSCFEWGETPYDCLKGGKPTDGIRLDNATKISDSETVMLFRRPYLFRRLNPSPLSYLQYLTFLRPCIDGDEKADLSNPFFTHILDAINYGLSNERIEKGNPPKSFLYNSENDLETSIIEFKELLMTGNSPTREFRRRLQKLESEGVPELIENEEFMKKMDELENKEVKLDIEKFNIDNLGDAIYEVSEEFFTAFFPLLGGNLSKLKFPRS